MFGVMRRRVHSAPIEGLEPRRLLSVQPQASPDAVYDYDFGLVEGVVVQDFRLTGIGSDGWFAFEIGARGEADNYILLQKTDFSPADLDLGLYDMVDDDPIDVSENYGSQETISLAGLSAGTYLINVYDYLYDGAFLPFFRVTISAPAIGDDEYEPNDTSTAATDLETIEGAVTLENLVLLDDDWYTFSTAATATANDYIEVSFNNADGDLDLALYDSDANLVDVSETAEDSERISLEGLPPDQYYLVVWGYDGDTNDHYDLTIHGPSLTDDSYEENDTLETAYDLGPVHGRVRYDDLVQLDDDYYRFETVATGGAGNDVRVDFLQAAGDLDLLLTDADGQVVGRSETVNDHEVISFRNRPAGTYYLLVYNYEDGGTNPDYALSFDAPVATLPDDANEPNDAYSQSTDLRQAGGTIVIADQTITRDDLDIFKFTTPSGTSAADYVQIDFVAEDGDLDLYLYDDDPAHNLLRTSNGTTGTERISLADLPAGTYYFVVAGYASETNRYTATLSIAEGTAIAPDARETNDSFAAANDLRDIGGLLRLADLSIHSPADVDYFQFTIADGVAANYAALEFANAAGDLDLELYNQAQVRLATSASSGDGERISLDLPAGTYYLKVLGYSGATNRYALVLNAPLRQAVAPDAYEANEPIRLTQNGTLSNLTIHAPAQNGGRGSRADTFVFTTLAAGGPTDQVRIAFAHGQGDLQLKLLNANGTVLATSQTSGDEESISLAGRPAGSYRLVVDSHNGGTNPDYSLSINAAFRDDSTLPAWTVLVYMSGDNDLESFAIQDINEMEAAGLSQDIRFGVLLDRVPGEDTSNGNWTDTRRGIIRGDYSTSTISSGLQSLGELDMSRPDTLTNFINWGAAALPAQHYALILWDHGGGIAGSEMDQTSGSRLMGLNAMRSALANSSVDISVIGFDACLMATAEVLAAVEGQADYLVASEESEGGDGWNYTRLGRELMALGSPTPRAVASTMVQSARDNDAIDTLSAVQVTGNTLINAVRTFVDTALDQAVTADWQVIRAARRAAPGYAYSFMRDVGAFMGYIADQVGTAAVADAARTVVEALDDAVFNNYNSPRRDGDGLSIYLPGVEEDLWSSYGSLAFAQSTGWLDFLQAMRTRISGPDRGPSRDWAESNDIRAQATNLEQLSAHNVQMANLSIDRVGDVDFFRFSTIATGLAEDDVRISFDNAQGNLDLFLYDSMGSLLSGSTGAEDTETVSLSGLAAGEYFVKIVGAAGATNDRYTLTINAPPSTRDWAENNNTRGKAYPIRLGTPNSGLVLAAGDVDWYRFATDRVPSTNPLVVTAMFNSAAGALSLALYDDAGAIVAQSQPIAGGVSLTYPDFGNKRLYLRVNGNTGGTALPYTLEARHDFSQTFAAPSLPQIRVVYRANKQDVVIGDGQAGAVNFGSVKRYAAAPTLTFRVYNTGTEILTLGRITLPKGFALVDPLVASLAPGKSDVFKVRMATTSSATRSGTLRFNTNVAEKNPFNFRIYGVVRSARTTRAAQAMTAAPVENGDLALSHAWFAPGSSLFSRQRIIPGEGLFEPEPRSCLSL